MGKKYTESSSEADFFFFSHGMFCFFLLSIYYIAYSFVFMKKSLVIFLNRVSG